MEHTTKFTIAFLVVAWWICSIWANVYSKKVFLHLHDFAIQLTFAQTTAAVFIVGLLFDYKLFGDRYFVHLVERISIKGVFMLSCLHAFGNLFTNVSMESANVSFAHTIKAAEPIFTIYFSRLMGKHEPTALYLATVPVMLGVAIASLGELRFSILGFMSAVLSNSCFAYRNVAVKNLEEGDNLGIFFLVSCGSSAILAVLHALKSTFHQPPGAYEDFSDAYFNLICAAVLHCSYNIFSFLVLGQVAPLTHAVINLVKRGAVIFVAIVAFSTPVNALNMTGILVTLAGGALFSLLKLRLTQQKSVSKADGEVKIASTQQIKFSVVKIAAIVGFIMLASVVSKPSATMQWNVWNPVDVDNTCPTDSWNKTLEWENPVWKVEHINKTNAQIIAMFGYTALQKNYHFGQYGASYAADREIRQRFGENAIIIPFSPMDKFVSRVDVNLPLASKVVYNWEGTFHGPGLHTTLLVQNVKKIADLNVPTYHMNIAWYPLPNMEKEVAETLNKMATLNHLAARDLDSYHSMHKAGLAQTQQSADLTFLLPFNFSCEVNRYFAQKNKFWTYPGRLRVVMTMTSAEGEVRRAIKQTVDIMTKELEGQVEAVSILDNVGSGGVTLAHLEEDTIYEAMWLLHNADLVITGRFHCGTYARIAGVPAVMLPGNTPKLDQLAKMIDSPAYPIVPKPEGKSWAQEIWDKAKEALAHVKKHPLDKDGILEKLRHMARNNFPMMENDKFFDRSIITMDELEREISFQSMVRNLTLAVATDKAPTTFGITYNTQERKYELINLV